MIGGLHGPNKYRTNTVYNCRLSNFSLIFRLSSWEKEPQNGQKYHRFRTTYRLHKVVVIEKKPNTIRYCRIVQNQISG